MVLVVIVKLYRLAVRRVAVRVGPFFLARGQRLDVRETLARDQTLERSEPVFVVPRAVVASPRSATDLISAASASAHSAM